MSAEQSQNRSKLHTLAMARCVEFGMATRQHPRACLVCAGQAVLAVHNWLCQLSFLFQPSLQNVHVY